MNLPRFHLDTTAWKLEIEPHVRFRGEAGEQWTTFVLDPAGNALEFKAFADDGYVFRRS